MYVSAVSGSYSPLTIISRDIFSVSRMRETQTTCRSLCQFSFLWPTRQLVGSTTLHLSGLHFVAPGEQRRPPQLLRGAVAGGSSRGARTLFLFGVHAGSVVAPWSYILIRCAGCVSAQRHAQCDSRSPADSVPCEDVPTLKAQQEPTADSRVLFAAKK